MRCIFCKNDSAGSRSREHIIPESLGNTKAVLPAGVVCDRCNNYFSREVERPFLESSALNQLRFHQAIPSKRGRIPPSPALWASEIPVTVCRYLDGPLVGSVFVDDPKDLPHILSSKESLLLFPGPGGPPNDFVVSRFLAKVAIEALADRFMRFPEPGGLDYLVDDKQFDPIRRHAREGSPRVWPYNARRIYDVDRPVMGKDGRTEQTVWEYDFFYTAAQEAYFVLALFGLELAINIGGPEIRGFLLWLEENKGTSPLYTGRNLLVTGS